MAVRNRKVAESMENISGDVEDISESTTKLGQKTMEGTFERATSPAFAAFEAFNGPFTKVMDQNRIMFQKMLQAMQEESLRFVNRRLEHTSRAIESSRECQGVTGLMSVHQEFLMDMARDYADQTRRFADLVRELADDGTSAWTAASSAMTEPVRTMSHRAEMRSEEQRSAAE